MPIAGEASSDRLGEVFEVGDGARGNDRAAGLRAVTVDDLYAPVSPTDSLVDGLFNLGRRR